jgi:hypothetical protein
MARLVVVAYSSCELATEKYYHMVNISLKSTMELFDHMEIILYQLPNKVNHMSMDSRQL